MGFEPHLLRRLLRVAARIRQRVYKEVCVVREGLRGLTLRPRAHQIVDDIFRQLIRDVVIAYHAPRIVQRSLVGAHRRSAVFSVGRPYVAGGRGGDGVAYAEAYELRAAGLYALCEHPAVHLGDVAADRVYLEYIRAGFQHDVRHRYLVGKRYAVYRAAHKGRAPAAYDYDEEVVGAGAVDDVEHYAARAVTLLVGQRVPADVYFGLVEDVRILGDLDDRYAAREPVAEYFVDGHRHVVARLAAAEQVDILFFRKVPFFYPDAERVSVERHYAFDALLRIQAPQRFFRDIEDDAP